MKSWLNFRAYKKTLLVKPFDQRDVGILVRRQRHRQELQQLEQAAVEAGGAVGGEAIRSPQRNNLLNLAAAQTSLLTTPMRHKRMKISTPLLRDRSGSVGSQSMSLRDRANSMGSEFPGMSPQRPVLAANRKSMLGKPFSIEIALVVKLYHLFRSIAEELCVDPRHLSLHFVPMGSHDWEERRFDTIPLSLGHGHMAINEALKAMRIANKASVKFCVFYSILPYSLLSEERRLTMDEYRLCDIYIADERIRYWRRLFIEHIKSHSFASLLETALLDSHQHQQEARECGAAAAAAAADKNGTGNGQQSANAVSSIRSRSNSEISTAAATATTTAAKANGARKRPREVSIVWPQIEYNDYEALVENCVNLRTPRTANMSAITSVLRDRIGIPCNMQDLDALKPVSSTPVTVATVDALEQMIASNSNSGCSDIISVLAEDRRIVPHFPLLIYNIQNYYIPTIFTPDCSANEFDGFG